MTTGQSDIYGYVEEIVGAFYFSAVNRRWDWNYCGAIISVLLVGLGGYQGGFQSIRDNGKWRCL